ncbi:hypothetical protein [Azospirillum argentinense]
MSAAPYSLERWMAPFAALFTRPTWRHALVLVAGTLFTPGRRTVTAALSIMGRREDGGFAKFHRVLNRNRWSSRAIGQRLFTLLVAGFVPQGPVVIGIVETIERRWGPKIKARGIYRDPVHSSHGHFVKASGLRWMVVMLLVPIPWAGRVWALPFLSALVPSERFAQETAPVPLAGTALGSLAADPPQPQGPHRQGLLRYLRANGNHLGRLGAGGRAAMGDRGMLRDRQAGLRVGRLRGPQLARLVPAHHPRDAAARLSRRHAPAAQCGKGGGSRAPFEPIAYSMPEIRHLITAFQRQCPPGLALILGWSAWRRAHQAIASAYHWGRQIMTEQPQL